MNYEQRVACDAQTAAMLAQGVIVLVGYNLLLGDTITGPQAKSLLQTVPSLRGQEQGAGLYVREFQDRSIVYIRDWGELGFYWADTAPAEQVFLLEELRGVFQQLGA